MIDFYYCPAVNGHKVRICLEELGVDYRVVPVDIGLGHQFEPDFLKISPNNKIPAIVDTDPGDGGGPVDIFESGAIMVYLAEKTGRLLPADRRGRAEVLKWVFWQVGHLGPMSGQAIHFLEYAPEDVPYGKLRYRREADRLYAVLDRQLRGRAWIAGDDCSIADIACYPWIVPHARLGTDLADHPDLKRWFGVMAGRPAVQRAYELAREFRRADLTDAARQMLFHQSRDVVQRTA